MHNDYNWKIPKNKSNERCIGPLHRNFYFILCREIDHAYELNDLLL